MSAGATGTAAFQPKPANEAERLAALRRHRILDTPAEAVFDDFVHLASLITGCPISMISFLDEQRQWFKAKLGVDIAQTPRDISFCTHAIAGDDLLLEVPDATRDARFQRNPLVVQDPAIRFYAGVQLVVQGGAAIGTLCVVDRKPGSLSAPQRDALLRLGRQVVAQIEFRSLLSNARTVVAQTHAELVESEVRFRAMSDGSPIGIFVTDPAGMASYFNPRWLDLVGLTLPEALGAGWREAIHPEDREMVARAWFAAASAGIGYEAEFRYLLRDGSVVWVKAKSSPMRMGSQVIGHVGAIEDITRARLAQEELVRTRDEALAGIRAKDDFLANMSHELRTPLTGIVGMSTIMAETGLSPEQSECMGIVGRCSDTLLTLIDNLLEASLGGQELHAAEAFRLAEVFDRATAPLRARFQAKGLEVRVEIDPALPERLVGQPLRLHRLLSHLLDNALKFTDRGGVLCRATGVGGGEVDILVADTGIGIDPRHAQTLFRPFSQGDSSRSRRFGGVGLGLSLAQRLAEAMGGRIRLAPSETAGSSFVVRLPLRAAPG